MTTTTTAARKNIASLRGGGGGSSNAPAPVSSGERVKMPGIPGIFLGFSEQDASDGKTGKLVEVTIIKAGVSANGLDYLPATLKEAAPLFAGVPIFSYTFGKSPSDEEKQRHLPDEKKTAKGHTGNMVAQIQESWWDDKSQSIRGLVAVFDETTRTNLRNAFEQKLLGKGVQQPVFGLSIDAAGLREGAAVTKIVRPDSLDMVKKAAAGGAFDRLVAEVTEEGEDEMTITKDEITKLVEETLGTNLGPALKAALKEEGEGRDPLSGLRSMMEGMDGDQRRALATRVLAMFREMGLAESSPEEKRAAAMHEAMKGLVESEKDPAKLKESLAKLVEDHSPAQKKDATTTKLEEAQAKLREMAIDRALVTFKLEDGRTFQDPRDAMRLADLSAVKVAEDYSEVEGLHEALGVLAQEKPYLLNAKESDEGKGAEGEGKPGEGGKTQVKEGDDEGGKTKPAPRGQEIRLTEEDGGEGRSVSIDKLQAEKDDLKKMMDEGRANDRDLARYAKVGVALKRAQALA